MEAAVGGLPINEVILSISFSEHVTLAGPKLLLALQGLLSEYPELEERLPYEMPEELPTEKLLKSRAPNIQIIGPAGPSKRRYWLTTQENGPILVQVQSDYFAVNWRARSETEGYPGFLRLREIFFETLAILRSAITQSGGDDINIQQVELSYINLIRPSGGYAHPELLGKVFDIQAPFLQDLEQLAISYTRSLTSPNGSFFGRLYTNVQTGYLPASDVDGGAVLNLTREPELRSVVSLNTSVRSARAKSLTFDEVSDILVEEHEAATRAFRSITKESARRAWGLSD